MHTYIHTYKIRAPVQGLAESSLKLLCLDVLIAHQVAKQFNGRAAAARKLNINPRRNPMHPGATFRPVKSRQHPKLTSTGSPLIGPRTPRTPSIEE